MVVRIVDFDEAQVQFLAGSLNINKMNENKLLSDSIAYCGLICKLCFLANKCSGCKTKCNICDNNLSDAGCYQKECCTKREISGCWECKELSKCNKGMYSPKNSEKVKAFALYIQKNNKDKFIEAILKNINNGFNIKKGKDYDNLDIKTIHKLLDTGKL